VALRVVRQELLANPQAVERFYQDVEASSKLSHDNLVHAYDAGPLGATHFLAMEHVPGIDLERLVKQRGPQTLPRACYYIYQAALGLQHALEHGLTHRALKPSKLIVTLPVLSDLDSRSGMLRPPEKRTADRPDVVKVADVGLSRLQSCQGVYLAPEQRQPGTPADTRADVYALGCIFHFVLTGQPPQVVDGRLVLPPLPAEVPLDVAAVIGRMTAVNPAERFATPGEAAQALQEHVTFENADRTTDLDCLSATDLGPAGSSQTLARRLGAAPERPRRWLRWVVGVGLVAALALAGGALWHFAPVGRPAASTAEGGAMAPSAARLELAQLNARARDPVADGGALWREVATFRRVHQGTPEARQAVELQLRLSSPLDRLDAGSLSPEDRALSGALKELTAVLGEQRWRTSTANVRSVAFHPQGKWAASTAGNDVILWDVPAGSVRAVLKGHTAQVNSVAFSSKGQLASVSHDKQVRLWDPATAKELAAHTLMSEVLSAAFAPDGETLVTGNKGGAIALWTSATGKKETARLANSKSPVTALAVSPNGKTVAVGSGDGKVRLWNLDADEERPVKLPEHGGGVTAIAFVPNSDLILSGGNDQYWRLSNVTNGKEVRKHKHGGQVVGVAVSPNGQLLASAGKDGTVRLFDVTSGQGRGILNDPDGVALTDVAFAPNGQGLLVGTVGTALRHWNLAPVQALTATRAGHVFGVNSIRFAADGSTLVTGSSDTTVRVWDAAQAKQRRVLKGHTGAVNAIAVSADGSQAASASSDRSVKLWDLPSGKELTSFPGLNTAMHAVQISPDGQLLAAGGDDGLIRAWNLATRDARAWLSGPAHTRPLRGLAFAPEGRELASAGLDKQVKLWKLTATEEQLKVSGTAWMDYSCVAIAPDGLTFAAGGDKLTRVWETATGKELGKLTGQSGTVQSVAYSPDGQQLAAASTEGQVSVWKAPQWQRIRHWQLPGAAGGVDFAPDGRHLAVATANGSIYLFRLASPGAAVK
ncbi:MAG: protein kinase, partial [Planctomycetia bacterium]|nr:protein kinase [Planctomycetia bacterium]